jgi:DNA anti-recombination protein RmuC
MGIKSWVLGWLLEDIYQQIKEVREKMATVEERLDGILATVVKVGGELKKQIADLQALIGTVTPEVQAKLDAIDASLKELDDLNPDVPA